jgi:hypothetical protein
MLQQLWNRFEAAVHEDDAELRLAAHQFLAELKTRVDAIELQLGITHAAQVAAPVAEVVPESQYVTDPVVTAPTETVSVPDAVQPIADAPAQAPADTSATDTPAPTNQGE